MQKIVCLIFPLLCIADIFAESADIYIPLSLDSAIQTGLKNNPEIKSAQARIKASGGRFLNAISPSSPEVTVSFDDIPSKQKINAFGENVIGVNQSIEFPTDYFIRGSKSKKEIKIAQQEFVQVKNSVISRIKTAYYNVLANKSKIEIARKNLQIADQFLKNAEIRFNAGEGTSLEKLTAKVQYTEAFNSVEIQKNHYSTALTELNYAMGNGKPVKNEYLLTDSLVFILYPLNIDTLIGQAAVNNPELIAGKLREEVLISDVKLAWSSYLPDFSIGAYTKKVSEEDLRYYGIAFGVTVPLWFMLDQNGKIKEASQNLISSRADLQILENSNRLQIKTAFNEFKDNERQVIYYRDDLLPQAEEVYRSASKSYQSGEITYIEFLRAQKTLVDSRSSYIDALLEYNKSIITLEQITGKTIQ